MGEICRLDKYIDSTVFTLHWGWCWVQLKPNGSVSLVIVVTNVLGSISGAKVVGTVNAF